MCGIAGILTISGKKVTNDFIKAMTDAIPHRGPDGEGIWINEESNVGFGHRRLSIIDLSDSASQPMHYAEGQYTITFNGEIYNYIELKEQLKKRGYKFRTNSDTEVLLALYDCKREKCLEELDGMFAFAIWDRKNKCLFCARDRFGEKPFHYFIDKSHFIFASEIKQFWSVGIKKELSDSKMLRYIHEGTIESHNDMTTTFYKNINRLDAAHYLIINTKGDLKIERYWDIDRDGKKYQGSVEEASGVFYSLLRDSIKLRLRSDVPVGSSLSGGLDSSSIVMLIDNLKGNELKQNTFSARFKDFKKDEGEHIETVVRACKNVSVHYTWPDSEYFEKVFDKVTYFQDEPYGSASIVAQYAVMEIAKEHNVTVLLDGQGADEQLAGYMPYYQLYLNQLFYDSKSKFNNEYNAYINYHNEQYPYKRIDDTETFRMKAGRYRRKLLHQQMPYHDALTNALYNSTINCGLKELLRYADRNSMAHSREVRLPFLSHKLVEFVFSLPDHFKINQGWTKYVLRKSMETTLPNSICWRIDKIGYEPPQSNWLKNAKYTSEIKRVSKLLQIESYENSNSIFNQEWRLLMASRFI